jgi:type VI secretion system protein ImpK
MQTVATAGPPISRSRVRLDNELVHLASPVLEIIMQVKANRVVPSNDLRRQIDALLKQLETRGEQAGYKERQIQAAKFSLAAFVDEMVLTAQFPLREQWEKHPLQLEYFGEHLAGVTFFNRLDDLIKDCANDADVVELFYLCLLLGYKGKYKIYYEQELKTVIEGVADHLRRANRLRGGVLSPHWRVADQPQPIEDTGIPKWVKAAGAIAIAAVVVIYMIFRVWLHSDAGSTLERLLR